MWYLDALFAVHPNMHGHTGGGLTMGQGFPIVASWKQKLNAKSLTESKLVGVEDMMPIILWTCYFLLSQGYGIIENLLLQDNLVGNVGDMLATCRADMSMLANFPDIPFFCRHPFLPIWPFPRV